MKIGILTYHRAENYGALLQAYAMMTYLRSLGHDVSFVDYWPKYHSEYFRIFSWKEFLKRSINGKILMIINTILPTKHIRKNRFQRFMHEKFHLSRKPLYSGTDDITEKYDVVIYGSDQIWRKQNLGGIGFDKWYYGSTNVNADKKIVYAGSMGRIVSSASDDDYVKRMMSNFDKISVRESDLQAYLRSLTIESELVIDPVFLLTKEQWSDIKKSSHIKYHYILFYNLLNNSESERFAKKLGTLKNLPVIELNKRIIPRKGYKRRASVENFIQLINDADVIVSNSFHGVAFSLIFHKEFYAIGMGDRSNRVISLLECAGLVDRYLQENVDVAHLKLLKDIDYQEVDDRLNNCLESSKSFLNNSIEK